MRTSAAGFADDRNAAILDAEAGFRAMVIGSSSLAGRRAYREAATTKRERDRWRCREQQAKLFTEEAGEQLAKALARMCGLGMSEWAEEISRMMRPAVTEAVRKATERIRAS